MEIELDEPVEIDKKLVPALMALVKDSLEKRVSKLK